MSKKNSAKDAELYIKNKRYNTSKTLATNDMWSKTIGHDPHANIVHDLDISVQALHGGGESEEFKNYLGAVLQHIITDSLEWGQDNKLARIGIGNNESPTDTHTESPPQQ